jgi:hypothetical protein
MQQNNLKQVMMTIIALKSCTFSKKFKVMYNKVLYKQNDDYEPVIFNNFLILIANTITFLLWKIYSQNPHSKPREKRAIDFQ